jgi:tripeptidyl-peptidase-1
VGGLTESPVLTVHQLLDVGVVQQQNQSIDYNEESNLDLEYAMALTDPMPVTVLQTGDLVEGSGVGSCDECVSLMSSPELVGAGFDNWLDAIDGSFCKFEGGDDPNQVRINLRSLFYILTSRF